MSASQNQVKQLLKVRYVEKSEIDLLKSLYWAESPTGSADRMVENIAKSNGRHQSYKEQYYVDQYNKGTIRAFVLERDSQLIGAVIFIIYESGHLAYIDSLKIHSEEQGKGYGSLLLGAVIYFLHSKHGGVSISLNSPLESSEFYSHNGFTFKKEFTTGGINPVFPTIGDIKALQSGVSVPVVAYKKYGLDSSSSGADSAMKEIIQSKPWHQKTCTDELFGFVHCYMDDRILKEMGSPCSSPLSPTFFSEKQTPPVYDAIYTDISGGKTQTCTAGCTII